jgi:hypothetical protein
MRDKNLCRLTGSGELDAARRSSVLLVETIPLVESLPLRTVDTILAVEAIAQGSYIKADE